MKILTTIHDLNNLNNLSLVADGFIIGTNQYSRALTLAFDNNILEVINKIKENQKEVFITFDGLYTDNEINDITNFLNKLPLNKIDGFIGGDIGLIQSFKNLKIENKFIYNPETLLTTHIDFNYFSDDNIMGAFVSKEITLNDILLIGKHKKYKTFMLGHGHMSMFYSKRKILSLFSDSNSYLNQKDITLKEPKRNESLPILEDNLGTHVYRGFVLNSFDHLNDLKKCIDYMVINTLFQSDEYALDVIPLYKEGFTKEDLKRVKEKYNETWHDGFLSKESIIKEY